MIQSGFIPNAHDDLVTDAAYDFYGLRLATCSLDQKIKIWGLNDETGGWAVEDEWKAHDAAVVKLSWAHPEFGHVLASASFDRTVKVWEQTAGASDPPAAGAGAGAPATRWVERAALLDARGTVRGVEFAPHHFGLKLATIGSDNFLRVYECLEPPALKAWQLSEEIDVPALSGPASAGVTAAPTLAAATPMAIVPPGDGGAPPASLVAHALQQQGPQADGRAGAGSREADGGWALSWCKDRYWGEVLAAVCGVSRLVKIIQLSPAGRPVTLLVLDPSPTGSPSPGSAGTPPATSPATYAATTVAWAPSCGRSYHLVATGARDGRVRIWKLRPPPPAEDGAPDVDGEEDQWAATIVADFDHHKSTVARVEWNITGTVLSSAGNDGRVRVWKATAGNVWRPAGHISVEQAEQQEPDVEMADLRER